MAGPIRKEVLDALGGYQRTDALSIDLAAFIESMAKESDRGMIVAMGSVLEDLLAAKLFERFVRSDKAFRKDLLRPGSLLATASDKLKLALAMGLIDERTADEIEVIAAMRNACAHSRQQIGFETPVLRDAMALLWRGENTREVVQQVRDPLLLRLGFVIAFSHILGRIRGETEEEVIKRIQDLHDILPGPTSPKKLTQLLKKIGRQVRTS